MTHEYHVVHHPKGGWSVKKSNAKRASFHFATKEEAFKKARALSNSHHAELVIHNLDGRISAKDSHGNDPRSIPG